MSSARKIAYVLHAQLIDAVTGHHVWAERFDTEATDLLTVQDQVAQKVVTGLEVTLTEGEQQRLRRADTTNPEAYDLPRPWPAGTICVTRKPTT